MCIHACILGEVEGGRGGVRLGFGHNCVTMATISCPLRHSVSITTIYMSDACVIKLRLF